MSRGVAQPGSAPALGAGGRAFKSPRPDQRKQLIYWQCRVSARLADQLTSITYPSYRQIQYGLDGADRVTSVKDVASGTNYATVSYTAPGGIDTMSLRNGCRNMWIGMIVRNPSRCRRPSRTVVVRKKSIRR